MNFYVRVGNNPVNWVDSYGLAVNANQVVSQEEVIGILQNIETQNNGDVSAIISAYKQSLLKKNQFIQLPNGEYIDMKHFMYSADLARKFGMELSVLAGVLVELGQWVTKNPSAFSPEDIPSDLLGAYFGATFGTRGNLSRTLQQYLRNISKQKSGCK